ncbi:MAG: PAS domain S-box protein, partial [bacterium]|nr:PAS domain S-box protein [bacterium]
MTKLTDATTPLKGAEPALGSRLPDPIADVPGHRGLIVVVVIALGMTTGLALLAKFLERATDVAAPVPELLYLVATVILATSSVYCFSRAYRARTVTVLVMIASVLIVTTPLLDTLENIAIIEGHPFFSGPLPVREFLDEGYLIGVAVLLFAVYLSLFKALRARHLLEQERARVARAAEERRRVESALVESEDKYRLVFDRANDGIALFTSDMRPDFFNERAAEMTGYGREELAELDPDAIVHPDDWGHMVESNRRRLAGEEFESTYEFRMMRKDGTQLP